jgi:raffinose/stachyose/melibiose transport system substrate-binding protein
MSKRMLKLVPILLGICMLVLLPVSAQEGQVLRIWHYEEDNAMGVSWTYAMERFQELHPDVTIDFELKTFDQIQQTAQMILNSRDVPDVMEINKGNATAGLYSSLGLLTDLTEVAEERGWTEIMSPSIQITCRYDESGIMGAGSLYGVTNYGEFVMVYYNKDMFEEYGVQLPTTLEEFEDIAQMFVDEGITPLALGALDRWPVTQNFYELVLYQADQELIDGFQFFRADLDFRGEAFTFGAQKLLEHVQRGFYSPDATGIAYDDANASFIQGQVPMNLTGSWMFGAFMDQITDFEWGIFILPDKQFNIGSGGNLWIVPENATNKELAYEFISLTLDPEVQTVMANAGGIPINADLTQIEDERILELNAAFSTIAENDGLAFYPDWPVPGYMDTLGSGLQELIGGTMTVEQFLDYIAEPHEEYRFMLP